MLMTCMLNFGAGTAGLCDDENIRYKRAVTLAWAGGTKNIYAGFVGGDPLPAPTQVPRGLARQESSCGRCGARSECWAGRHAEAAQPVEHGSEVYIQWEGKEGEKWSAAGRGKRGEGGSSSGECGRYHRLAPHLSLSESESPYCPRPASPAMMIDSPGLSF